MVLPRPPMPTMPVVSASCASPAMVPEKIPTDRAAAKAEVDDRDQHEVDADRTAHQEPRQRRLQHQRDADDRQHAKRVHGRLAAGGGSAGPSGRPGG